MNEQLKQIIDDSNAIVFFGGAGVSTESGIPDFRSKDGLYHQKGFKYDPETMLSRSFFDSHTEEFFRILPHQNDRAERRPQRRAFQTR